MLNKSQSLWILFIVGVLLLTFIPSDVEGSITKAELARVKRGHGHGGGGGGGGHGPGAGGGAAGPVYFCGWVGKGEGSRGYGGYGK